jgi:cell division septal protein FtsQ
MEEESKRKEKPKNKAKRGVAPQPFILAVGTLVILFLLGIALTIFLVTRENPQTLQFTGTKHYIETQNAIAMTQISASATAFIATATAEAGEGQ